MDLPNELWDHDADRALAHQLVELFVDVPVVLTDRLTNSIYLNEAAERLLGQRAEAVVNRAAFSLLGFGSGESTPQGLVDALLGQAPSWRSVVRLFADESLGHAVCEASAVCRGEHHVCGVLRFTPVAVAVD